MAIFPRFSTSITAIKSTIRQPEYRKLDESPASRLPGISSLQTGSVPSPNRSSAMSHCRTSRAWSA